MMRLGWQCRLLVLGVAAARVGAVVSGPDAFQNPLITTEGLVPQMVNLEAATYHGRPAVHVVNAPNAAGQTFPLVPGREMRDGTIDIDVAGQPAASARENMRGFIGVMFRTARDLSQFECVYIRPTNGRADDQLRRNHSTQYISFPGFPWEKLRADTPGVYESYVDLKTGECRSDGTMAIRH